MISREDVAKVLEQRARDCESGTFALPPDVARYMAGGILALLQPEVAALEERARKLESEEHISPGTGMYLALARSVIDRILSAEANCDPPLDILLRLESIIRERDALKADLATVGDAVVEAAGELEREHAAELEEDVVDGRAPRCLCGICEAIRDLRATEGR